MTGIFMDNLSVDTNNSWRWSSKENKDKAMYKGIKS